MARWLVPLDVGGALLMPGLQPLHQVRRQVMLLGRKREYLGDPQQEADVAYRTALTAAAVTVE